MTNRKTPTLAAFKRFSADVAPAAKAVLMARVFAEMERERVNAYVLPIFQSFAFHYAKRWGKSGLIEKPEHLYLCDDEPMTAAYFKECDTAHRAHGFTGPDGHCPALHADALVIAAENALMQIAEHMFGIEVGSVYGENRAKYLDLLIGAAIKADKERRS